MWSRNTYTRQAIDLVSAGSQLQQAHVNKTRMPDRGDRLAYGFGYLDGTHGNPEEPHPDMSRWKRKDWSPEQYREGYSFGKLVRDTARELYGKCPTNESHPRPDEPEWGRCHRPVYGPMPADAKGYRNKRGEHVTAHSRILLDLPPKKDGGIVFRWWEGCVGCGAIRPVDEYHGGVVKWRAWRWPETEPVQQALTLTG